MKKNENIRVYYLIFYICTGTANGKFYIIHQNDMTKQNLKKVSMKDKRKLKSLYKRQKITKKSL